MVNRTYLLEACFFLFMMFIWFILLPASDFKMLALTSLVCAHMETVELFF